MINCRYVIRFCIVSMFFPMSLVCSVASMRADAYSSVDFKIKNMCAWIKRCKKLPFNRSGNVDMTKDTPFAMLGDGKERWAEYKAVVEAWVTMMKTRNLFNLHQWSYSNEQKLPKYEFYNQKREDFIPYAQKLIAHDHDVFYLHGDLHGDTRSQVAQLEQMYAEGIIDDQFRIIPDNVWLVYLGDYVDRGHYGCEVIYTLLRLALANPDRVVLVRGNHEDLDVNLSMIQAGFVYEAKQKFQTGMNEQYIQEIINKISDLYRYMPVVFYIGVVDEQNITNYIQCCHGGLEVGYFPQSFLDDHATMYQLIGSLDQKKFVYAMSHTGWGILSYANNAASWWSEYLNLLYDKLKPISRSLGFMWNDFDVPNKKQVHYHAARGFRHGKDVTKEILKMQSSKISRVRAIIRAHQHGDPEMMEKLLENKGVYKMWHLKDDVLAPYPRYIHDGLVWTLNVSPDSWFGDVYHYDFDAYALLQVAQNYLDWVILVFNKQILPNT